MNEFQEAVVGVAVRAGLPEEEARRTVGVPKERERADLTLPCFAFARALKRAPQQIAKEVAEAFEPDQWLAAAEAVGPFVNFRVNRTAFAARTLGTIDESCGRSEEGAGKTIVIDYGSPNIAKPLLFHHLRSAVIGQALANLYRWRGYEVVGLNFVGDVGTAFGKLMVGIEELGEPDSVAAFNRTYVEASRGCDEKPAWLDRARVWAKRLEEDDPEAVGHWKKAREMSLAGFGEIYDRLGVHHDVVDGERMYVRRARELVERLVAEGKAEESQGGIVVPTGLKTPFLVRKRDGATLYGTRDIVAAMDRWERYRFDRMLYVVDVAQEVHFRQLFAALKGIGCDWADRCRHVPFGQVLIGGSRAKTREGESIQLADVLRESERRAQAIIEEKNAALRDKEAVARAVGTAAVIFCDVGYPVTKNINFDWDEILTFDGRTGPYLQYVHASACSILRKGGGAGTGDPSLLTHTLEWELIRRLAEFDAALAKAAAESEPSLVSNHLYDLARDFRAYHTAGGRDASLRVLVDDAAVRAARLMLVDAVRCTLAAGLRLLGIEPLEEM
ncbi:MAG: arginine--tRNA ligase [Planctomycetota bacterium]|jgi:arginyl-tRNA synthetase